MKNKTYEYASFAELSRNHVEGEDFFVDLIARESAVVVMAPHGGKIEPHTDAIAAAIAADELALYLFRGNLPRNNRQLHLTSHLFDEPRALRAAGSAAVVVAIHGAAGATRWTMVGGRATVLSERISEELRSAGFIVRPCPAHLSANSPHNI